MIMASNDNSFPTPALAIALFTAPIVYAQYRSSRQTRKKAETQRRSSLKNSLDQSKMSDATTIRVLLNGKKAGLPEVRSAISSARTRGIVEVRPTFEGGDVARLVREAATEQCTRIVAGGGDGTVNEVADAVSKLPEEERPEIAILPLGTANDFATGCAIPTADLDAALELAQNGTARPIDLIRVNDDRCFVNMATGGFGAQVTLLSINVGPLFPPVICGGMR